MVKADKCFPWVRGERCVVTIDFNCPHHPDFMKREEWKHIGNWIWILVLAFTRRVILTPPPSVEVQIYRIEIFIAVDFFIRILWETKSTCPEELTRF
jgi:hypothetical protein